LTHSKHGVTANASGFVKKFDKGLAVAIKMQCTACDFPKIALSV
jgi:hypothetical protein